MAAMRPTVVLFDIDGTLISSCGAGRRAMERGFADVTGRADACSGFSFDGMTDRVIVRQGLSTLGVEPDAARVEAVLDAYVAHLPEEISRAHDYRVHAGIEAVLRALRGRALFALGLGTGNIKRGALIKLGHVGLHPHFGFGGFGCDHEERAEILRTGAERGAASLGCTPADCRVLVIGDTPKDVAAARAIGAECLGVGTGRFSPETLRAEGAAYAFADLAAPAALEVILG